MDELERRREQSIAEYLAVASPVLDDLRDVGFDVVSIGELSGKRLNYERAIPVLLRWLPRIDDRRVKEDIVRALSVKWARPTAAAPLIEEFRRVEDETGLGLKWAVGSALEVVADDAVFEDLVHLVQHRRHGRAREMIAVALGNMKDPRAVDVLIELLNDDEVAGHALMGLRKLGAKKARPYIEPFLNHPRTWWRNEAKRALQKIDKVR